MFGQRNTEEPLVKRIKPGMIFSCPMDQIDVNPDNSHVFNMQKVDAIAQSIAEHGYMEESPIGVYLKPDNRFEINAGHTRYYAMKQLGRTTIPAVLKETKDEAGRAEALLLSNINTRNMTAMDWANAIEYYIEKCIIPRGVKGQKNELCAQFFHSSVSSVKRYRRLSKLIPELKELANDNSIPYVPLTDVAMLSPEAQQEFYSTLMQEINEQMKIDTETVSISSHQMQSMYNNIIWKREQKKKREEEADMHRQWQTEVEKESAELDYRSSVSIVLEPNVIKEPEVKRIAPTFILPKSKSNKSNKRDKDFFEDAVIPTNINEEIIRQLDYIFNNISANKTSYSNEEINNIKEMCSEFINKLQ